MVRKMSKATWVLVMIALVAIITMSPLTTNAATTSGTVSYTSYQSGGIAITDISWTCDASGNVVSTGTVTAISGMIAAIITQPVNAPTDNYDVTIKDSYGMDYARGLCANRHTTTTQSVCPLIVATDGTSTATVMVPISGRIDLTISSAGATKSGKIRIFVKRN
jgi:hypothetical protein